jgi:hypothetical protein
VATTQHRSAARYPAAPPLGAAPAVAPVSLEYNEWLAWMKKYNTSGNVADADTVYGYSAAQTMVAVLKACGDNITRENLMKQAASIHDLQLPMLLPGIIVSTSANDFACLATVDRLGLCHRSQR